MAIKVKDLYEIIDPLKLIQKTIVANRLDRQLLKNISSYLPDLEKLIAVIELKHDFGFDSQPILLEDAMLSAGRIKITDQVYINTLTSTFCDELYHYERVLEIYPSGADDLLRFPLDLIAENIKVEPLKIDEHSRAIFYSAEDAIPVFKDFCDFKNKIAENKEEQRLLAEIYTLEDKLETLKKKYKDKIWQRKEED